MIEISRIIVDLENIKKYPNMYIQPVTPEGLAYYLGGLQRGILLCNESLTFQTLVEAHCIANRARGWQDRPISPFLEMRGKEISEDDIIQKLVEIEIDVYRILSQTMEQSS